MKIWLNAHQRALLLEAIDILEQDWSQCDEGDGEDDNNKQHPEAHELAVLKAKLER